MVEIVLSMKEVVKDQKTTRNNLNKKNKQEDKRAE